MPKPKTVTSSHQAKPLDATKGFVTAQQVAERAGVSKSAVSRTFTQGASISSATRKKVIEAAAELGYHVNHLARGLIHEKSNIVAVVAADLFTPHQSRMLDALTVALQQADKVAMVINTSGHSADVAALMRQTLNYRADATVVLSGQPDRSLVETSLNSRQRVILINRDDSLPGPVHIGVTAEAPAGHAVQMLQRAQCKRLLLVTSKVGTPSIELRERAFLQAAQRSGLEVVVEQQGLSNYATGADIARRALSQRERPDGVFCVTDLMACGFCDVARFEFGLRIPEEMCVIGFDDIEQAGWASYNLTTFRQPVEEVVGCIIEMIDDPTLAADRQTILFEAQPVWRKSVRPR